MKTFAIPYGTTIEAILSSVKHYKNTFFDRTGN
jgi:hypothetical protein